MSTSWAPLHREWVDRIARWESSGLSRDDFAAREGITGKKLVRWRWNLRQLQSAAPAPVPQTALTFVRLETSTPSISAMPLEVVLSSGRTVRVPVDFDEATLSRIVTLLERGAA